MAPASTHIKQKKNRRKKKRRTEDFSSDSDSDSSSGSGNDTVENVNQDPSPEQDQSEKLPQVNIDGMDVASDDEKEEDDEESLFSKELQEKIKSVKFTVIQNQSTQDASETLKKDRKELDNQFLEYMASSFSDDIDSLRKKPDFKGDSIVMLAKTLQSGSNMFDSETIEALLK